MDLDTPHPWQPSQARAGLQRRQLLWAAIGMGSALIAPESRAYREQPLGGAANTPAHWRSRPLLGFGTSLSLTVGADTAAKAELALDLAVADIRHIEQQMSLFRANSAVCQLNASGLLRNPDPMLVRVLRLAQTVSQQSQGAFDITVQPLWLLYAQAQREDRLPWAAALLAARDKVDWQQVEVRDDRVRLKRPGMAITLNGIAQGFAADVIKARWQTMGIEHALINTGEWSALGRAQDGKAWQLGIANPRDADGIIRRIAASGRSVATSADSQTFFTADFQHHHIFDPHTGDSPADVSSVTVVADSCALADALTKVMFVAGKAKALDLAKTWGVEVLLVDKAGRWVASPGLMA